MPESVAQNTRGLRILFVKFISGSPIQHPSQEEHTLRAMGLEATAEETSVKISDW